MQNDTPAAQAVYVTHAWTRVLMTDQLNAKYVIPTVSNVMINTTLT
jgi:hypothetical protein